MLSWILIALAIAFIFGVIKVESIKEQAEIWLPKIKQYCTKMQSCGKAKIEEMKALADKKSDTKKEDNTQDKTEE